MAMRPNNIIIDRKKNKKVFTPFLAPVHENENEMSVIMFSVKYLDITMIIYSQDCTRVRHEAISVYKP